MAAERSHSATREGSALVITRTFNAPRELVWKAWTQCEHVSRWWGPKGFTGPKCQIDFRVGGKYLFCMRSPEGKDYWSTGVYREIVPIERFVCSDSFADERGNVVSAAHYGMPDVMPLEMEITVILEEENGKTRMTLRHTDMPEGEMSTMAGAGWNESFDKLVAFLDQEKGG